MRTSLLLLACLFAACNSSRDKTQQRTPQQQKKYAASVARKEVLVGMKKSEVRKAWGTPQRTKRSIYRSKRVTVWEYAFSEFYFDADGYVVGWITAGH